MLTAKEKRNLYMKDYLQNKEEFDKRINDGIKNNRMGSKRIRVVNSDGTPYCGEIKIKQINHDFKYGANIFLLDGLETEEKNLEYRRFFKEYFNLATVPFYWEGLEPVRGKPRYKKDSEMVYRRPSPDLCLDYCDENGILAKLHCLVYDKFVPDWVTELSFDEVKFEYEKRIKEIAERYRGRMYEFEITNETLSVVWWNRPHSKIFEKNGMVKWCYEVAEKYLPHETFVINDGLPFKELSDRNYVSPYFLQCDLLISKGAKIDKIGLQNHLFTGAMTHNDEEYEQSVKSGTEYNNPYYYFSGLDVMAELNRPLELTEVTIPTFGDTEEDEQLQADMLKLWYSIWFSHLSVETVVYWNTVDGYAYKDPYWNENNCRGGLFHHDLTPKKSAIELYNLFHKIWHTEITATTDKDGYFEFDGFYGDYQIEIENQKFDLSIHKNDVQFAKISINK